MTDNNQVDLRSMLLDAARSDPRLTDDLLADFAGTVKRRFGVDVPSDMRLERADGGLRLIQAGRAYDLGDPLTAAPDELNDAELDLVAGGKGSDTNNSSQASVSGVQNKVGLSDR